MVVVAEEDEDEDVGGKNDRPNDREDGRQLDVGTKLLEGELLLLLMLRVAMEEVDGMDDTDEDEEAKDKALPPWELELLPVLPL